MRCDDLRAIIKLELPVSDKSDDEYFQYFPSRGKTTDYRRNEFRHQLCGN
jgi:hypothetical protein